MASGSSASMIAGSIILVAYDGLAADAVGITIWAMSIFTTKRAGSEKTPLGFMVAVPGIEGPAGASQNEIGSPAESTWFIVALERKTPGFVFRFVGVIVGIILINH